MAKNQKINTWKLNLLSRANFLRVTNINQKLSRHGTPCVYISEEGLLDEWIDGTLRGRPRPRTWNNRLMEIYWGANAKSKITNLKSHCVMYGIDKQN